MEEKFCEYTSLMIDKLNSNDTDSVNWQHIMSCETCNEVIEIRKVLMKDISAVIPVRSGAVWYEYSLSKLLNASKTRYSRQLNLSLALKIAIVGFASAVLFAGSTVGFRLPAFLQGGLDNDWWLHPITWITITLSIIAGLAIKKFSGIKI